MKKYVCLVCGYVYEGEEAPAECPICHAPASKFSEQSEDMTWAAEHVIGIAKGVDQRIIDGLRENFTGECTEVGMYLAMSRAAHREGYPEIGLYWEKAALEEADHAAKFAEMLGEVVSESTKENLKVRNDVVDYLADRFVYVGGGGCMVCNGETFVNPETGQYIHYHRGIEHSCVRYENRTYVNDVIIRPDGRVYDDWDWSVEMDGDTIKNIK